MPEHNFWPIVDCSSLYATGVTRIQRCFTQVSMVTSGHVTKMAVTWFGPQLPKPPTIRKLHGFITVCTVVQNCCKGDSPCQWNAPILDPQGSKTPEPIDIKLQQQAYKICLACRSLCLCRFFKCRCKPRTVPRQHFIIQCHVKVPPDVKNLACVLVILVVIMLKVK